MWQHVDAAYGGFFTLTDRGREALAGIERSDSITLDPHKGLAQPWGTGCVLTRSPTVLSDTFRMYPGYLRDARQLDDAVNLFDRGLQLTRPARAVKIWLSVETLGLAPFREALDAALDSALVAQSYVEGHPDAELVTPACLGIITFRRRDGRDEETSRLFNGAQSGTCRRPSLRAASHSDSASIASGRPRPTWRPCWRSCSAPSPDRSPPHPQAPQGWRLPMCDPEGLPQSWTSSRRWLIIFRGCYCVPKGLRSPSPRPSSTSMPITRGGCSWCSCWHPICRWLDISQGPAPEHPPYDAAHTYVIPIIVGTIGVVADTEIAVQVGLIWLVHIGVDRAIGYGLKYPTSFKDTHLQRV